MARFFGWPAKGSRTLVFVKDDDHGQGPFMPLIQGSPAQLESIKRATRRLGERGDPGRVLCAYLIEQRDDENADLSVRCAMKNLEAAIREMRDELRSIMH